MLPIKEAAPPANTAIPPSGANIGTAKAAIAGPEMAPILQAAPAAPARRVILLSISSLLDLYLSF